MSEVELLADFNELILGNLYAILALLIILYLHSFAN